eukprot:gene28672-31849_t
MLTLAPISGTRKYLMKFRGEGGYPRAHIHEGAEGTIGPIIFGEFPSGSPLLTGSFSYPITVSASILDESVLTAEGYYYNVHTFDFPAGEIRGQFKPPAV